MLRHEFSSLGVSSEVLCYSSDSHMLVNTLNLKLLLTSLSSSEIWNTFAFLV